jgi:hypothetical protein
MTQGRPKATTSGRPDRIGTAFFVDSSWRPPSGFALSLTRCRGYPDHPYALFSWDDVRGILSNSFPLRPIAMQRVADETDGLTVQYLTGPGEFVRGALIILESIDRW